MDNKDKDVENKLDAKADEPVEREGKDIEGKIDNKSEDSTEEKMSIGEKIEDTIDGVVEGVQNFFYGERVNSNEDIPATMVDPDNEIRHINKVQTRRNFNRRYGYKFLKWFFIIIGVGLVISLVGGLIGKLLMA